MLSPNGISNVLSQVTPLQTRIPGACSCWRPPPWIYLDLVQGSTQAAENANMCKCAKTPYTVPVQTILRAPRGGGPRRLLPARPTSCTLRDILSRQSSYCPGGTSSSLCSSMATPQPLKPSWKRTVYAHEVSTCSLHTSGLQTADEQDSPLQLIQWKVFHAEWLSGLLRYLALICASPSCQHNMMLCLPFWPELHANLVLI